MPARVRQSLLFPHEIHLRSPDIAVAGTRRALRRPRGTLGGGGLRPLRRRRLALLPRSLRPHDGVPRLDRAPRAREPGDRSVRPPSRAHGPRARGGRPMGTFEIDISMPCSISDDRAAARRAAKRPAAQGILWMAGAEKYSRQRADWRRPTEFDVPDHVVTALAKWDFWTQPYLPLELADLITDDVLDQFALAGTPEECAERLRDLHATLPDVTGVRLYALPPPSDSWSGGYVTMP